MPAAVVTTWLSGSMLSARSLIHAAPWGHDGGLGANRLPGRGPPATDQRPEGLVAVLLPGLEETYVFHSRAA